jgi:hypothetical protein
VLADPNYHNKNRTVGESKEALRTITNQCSKTIKEGNIISPFKILRHYIYRLLLIYIQHIIHYIYALYIWCFIYDFAVAILASLPPVVVVVGDNSHKDEQQKD